jgi:hypothetical protein
MLVLLNGRLVSKVWGCILQSHLVHLIDETIWAKAFKELLLLLEIWFISSYCSCINASLRRWMLWCPIYHLLSIVFGWITGSSATFTCWDLSIHKLHWLLSLLITILNSNAINIRICCWEAEQLLLIVKLSLIGLIVILSL